LLLENQILVSIIPGTDARGTVEFVG